MIKPPSAKESAAANFIKHNKLEHHIWTWDGETITMVDICEAYAASRVPPAEVSDFNPPYGWKGTKQIENAMLASPLVCRATCYGQCGRPFHIDYRVGGHLFPKRKEDFDRIRNSLSGWENTYDKPNFD